MAKLEEQDKELDKDEEVAEVEASVLWEVEEVGMTNCRFVALRFS